MHLGSRHLLHNARSRIVCLRLRSCWKNDLGTLPCQFQSCPPNPMPLLAPVIKTLRPACDGMSSAVHFFGMRLVLDCQYTFAIRHLLGVLLTSR